MTRCKQTKIRMNGMDWRICVWHIISRCLGNGTHAKKSPFINIQSERRNIFIGIRTNHTHNLHSEQNNQLHVNEWISSISSDSWFTKVFIGLPKTFPGMLVPQYSSSRMSQIPKKKKRNDKSQRHDIFVRNFEEKLNFICHGLQITDLRPYSIRKYSRTDSIWPSKICDNVISISNIKIIIAFHSIWILCTNWRRWEKLNRNIIDPTRLDSTWLVDTWALSTKLII